MASLIAAGFIIPAKDQALLNQLKVIAIPVVELGLMAFLIFKTRKVIQRFKATPKVERPDFFDAVSIACAESFPGRAGKFLAFEISVFYYLFRKNPNPLTQQDSYTYFKKNGIKMVIGVFIGLIITETVVMHLLIHRWNVLVAWVLTFLSIYTCLQIIAILRSLDHRLISIDNLNQKLHLRYGFVNYTTIDLRDIQSIALDRKSLPIDNSVIPFSPFDLLDNHNIIIQLKKEHTLNRIYGFQKKYTNIAIYVDDKERFVEEVKNRINKEPV